MFFIFIFLERAGVGGEGGEKGRGREGERERKREEGRERTIDVREEHHWLTTARTPTGD